MERVTFLVEDTHERITALLNPSSVVSRRSAVVRERRSLPVGSTSGFFDHGPVVTGGGITEMELDLLFDTSLAGSNIATEDVRALTEPLWRLAEARADAGTSLLQLPRLRLIWGKAWNVPAVVVDLAERLEHFDASGSARRSWLRLRLRRVPERAEACLPGALAGLPIARTFAGTEVETKPTNAEVVESPGKDGKTVAELSDLVANALASSEAKELTEQAAAALEDARETFVSSGFGVSLNVSLSTRSFAFEMSFDVDLSALTPAAIAARVGGWLRWAREGLSSLGALAKRLGLSAVRRIKAGMELIADRIAAFCAHVGGEMRAALTSVQQAMAISAQRVARLARVVGAEVHRRVMDGYRAMAFAVQKAARAMAQHIEAILQATSRMAAGIGERVRNAARVLVEASEAVLDAIATTAIDAYRLAGKTIRSGAKTLRKVTEDVAATVRATLVRALSAARDAGAVLVGHLREVAPEVLKWAKDALLRTMATLGDAAFLAASGFERAGHFVLDSGASTLSCTIAKTKVWLASRSVPADPPLAWELTEAAASDDMASNEALADAIRSRIARIVPKLALLEQSGSTTELQAIQSEIAAVSMLVVAEEATHCERTLATLERPALAPPAGVIRLDLLAFEQGGDPRCWKRIAEANNIDDPLAVPKGIPLDLSCLSFQRTP